MWLRLLTVASRKVYLFFQNQRSMHVIVKVSCQHCSGEVENFVNSLIFWGCQITRISREYFAFHGKTSHFTHRSRIVTHLDFDASLTICQKYPKMVNLCHALDHRIKIGLYPSRSHTQPVVLLHCMLEGSCRTTCKDFERLAGQGWELLMFQSHPHCKN